MKLVFTGNRQEWFPSPSPQITWEVLQYIFQKNWEVSLLERGACHNQFTRLPWEKPGVIYLRSVVWSTWGKVWEHLVLLCLLEKTRIFLLVYFHQVTWEALRKFYWRSGTALFTWERSCGVIEVSILRRENDTCKVSSWQELFTSKLQSLHLSCSQVNDNLAKTPGHE